MCRMTIAKVAIDAALDRLFDYAVPSRWQEQAVPGARVRVPFGRREATGYIVELVAGQGGEVGGREAGKAEVAQDAAAGSSATPPELPGLESVAREPAARQFLLKEISAVEGEQAFILPPLLKLAQWLAHYYAAPLERCLQTLLPAPVRGKARVRERLFVEAVQGGARSAAKQTKSGAAKEGDEADAAALTARQQELLADIRRVGGGWLQALCAEFSCSPATLHKLAALGVVTIAPKAQRRDPLAKRRILPTQPLELNREQAAALAALKAAAASVTAAPLTADSSPVASRQAAAAPVPLLLYGVTGSGKTEVYLQAIAHMLERGFGAIVLVPEIALTPQTVQRFAGRFGTQIAVLHSALSDGERFDEWQRIRRGEARVVVGPRSAVFAPVERLGLIVVDEEHEPSYKQDEAPRYHARDVAVMRGHIEGALVVLGSATPALESWHNVERGKYRLARLTERAAVASMPSVQVVDMRIEQSRSGHVQLFSQALLDAIKLRLERGEQTMLFLNRRGYATSLLCPSCGFVATCEACAVAYTYHRVDDCLRCHLCGGWQRPAATCPACHDPKFKYAGFGTQRIEAVVATCFPQARIGRMDADATSRKLSHDEILGAFRSGRTDILIGTQMIAKGLHFPNVTLVGVVLADSTLHLPDFRAGERTFQLLSQVAGRAGRGATAGEVLLQTYTPDHPAITAACSEDFATFAAGELPIRRRFGYPPYRHLTCLTLRSPDEGRVTFGAERLVRSLVEAAGEGGEVDVSEASPAPLAKIKNIYRYQIILRATATRSILLLLRHVLRTERLPPEVELAVDIDAISLL